MSQANPTNKEINDYCEEYLVNGNNQTRAWRAAFPKSKATNDSVNQLAVKFNKQVKVQSRFRELEEIAEDAANARFGITARYLIEVNQRVIEAGLRMHPDKDGNCKAENLGAVVSAGGAISKICGHDAPTKSEVDANVKVQKISVEFIGND